MTDKTKTKAPYILGADSKMKSFRLPVATIANIDALSKAGGKSKTMVIVEAVDAFVIRDRILTEHDNRMAGGVS